MMKQPTTEQTSLPPLFLERLQRIIPAEDFSGVLKCFSLPRILSVRINTLKTGKNEILSILKTQNISYREIDWYQEALVLDNKDVPKLNETDLIQKGWLYAQSLSSMLPVLALDLTEKENILDMCAAPGSKTTQMAAHLRNSGFILALESVKERYYKLKSVVQLLGATNVEVKCTDARRFSGGVGLFDKILLDTPCSSEGRFKNFDEKTRRFWSPRKIKEMVQKQKSLLMQASRLLKPGGILVYSTCTFAPEENEASIDWFLKKTKGMFKTVPSYLPLGSLQSVQFYPPIQSWQGKAFGEGVRNCLRVLPTEEMEGFFLAKLQRET